MGVLTITIVLVAVVLLLAGIFVGRRFVYRAGKPTQSPQRHGNIRPRPAPARASQPGSAPVPAKAQVVVIRTTIEALDVRLINCFGGNRGAMDRTMELYRRKFPHLTEIESREKILYDLERGK